MDNKEARQVLLDALQDFRTRPYSELVGLIGEDPFVKELQGSGKSRYQIEIQVFWDGRPAGNVRVIGSVDDGGWRFLVPLSEDFIKSPDGGFVGE